MDVKRYKDFNELEKEFYFHLGLISTRFAVVEYNVLRILGSLISDDFVLTNTLFERNTLHQNIEFLKKISSLKKDIENEAINNLVIKISNIRRTRNLFVHGLWGEPQEKENDLIIRCDEPKMDYSETRRDGEIVGRQWASVKTHIFRLSYLKKLAADLSDIILAQKHILKRIEEYDEYN